MVSESNTNMRHLQISNTHDQITTLQNQGGIFKRVSSSRYPDISVKDTLVMDILVTYILVAWHFGKTNKYSIKAYFFKKNYL